jgi:hypothetical protein
MVQGSADLGEVLVEFFFHIIVELVKIDRFGAEEEVVESGNADELVHIKW